MAHQRTCSATNISDNEIRATTIELRAQKLLFFIMFAFCLIVYTKLQIGCVFSAQETEWFNQSLTIKKKKKSLESICKCKNQGILFYFSLVDIYFSMPRIHQKSPRFVTLGISTNLFMRLLSLGACRLEK